MVQGRDGEGLGWCRGWVVQGGAGWCRGGEVHGWCRAREV